MAWLEGRLRLVLKVCPGIRNERTDRSPRSMGKGGPGVDIYVDTWDAWFTDNLRVSGHPQRQRPGTITSFDRWYLLFKRLEPKAE